jgi:deazaflavin-dependent oxidoreductase (nitroreductase family)
MVESERSWLFRAAEWLGSTKVGTWFMLTIASPIDRWLLRKSGGRLSVAVGQPVALLKTIGARSGLERRTPLLYVRDGIRVLLIASNGGKPHHPAWYYNLKAHPRVRLLLPEEEGAYVAHEAEGKERERLWRKITDHFSAYDVYRARAGERRIPIMVLTPVQEELDE